MLSKVGNIVGNSSKSWLTVGIVLMVFGWILTLSSFGGSTWWRYNLTYTVSGSSSLQTGILIYPISPTSYTTSLDGQILNCDKFKAKATAVEKQKWEFCDKLLNKAGPALLGLSIFAFILLIPLNVYLCQRLAVWNNGGSHASLIKKIVVLVVQWTGMFFFMVAIAAYGGQVPTPSDFEDLAKLQVQNYALLQDKVAEFGVAPSFGMNVGCFFFWLAASICFTVAFATMPRTEEAVQQQNPLATGQQSGAYKQEPYAAPAPAPAYPRPAPPAPAASGV